MRIVKRPAFLSLPAGVVFSTYEPCVFGELMLKGDTIGNDFYCASLVGAVAWSTSGDIYERCDAMEREGSSFPADFESFGRDGSFAPGTQLYAIYEPADIQRLIATLQRGPMLGPAVSAGPPTSWDGSYTFRLPHGLSAVITIAGTQAKDTRASITGVATVTPNGLHIRWSNGTTWIITGKAGGPLALQTPNGPSRITKS